MSIVTEDRIPKDNPSDRYGTIQRRKPSQRQWRIGKYCISKTLGSGSMGKVKLATNTETNEKLAVKIISRKVIQPEKHSKNNAKKEKKSEKSREIRIIREASIMLLLDHPYIAKLEEMVLVNEKYYQFMEYVDGGQLLDYIISHGKLRERHARKFARQIASALDYCHRNSIVHRDLKVENILISRNGNVKLIDFGLSNVFSPQSQLSTFCGSLYFAAPELLSGIKYVGPEVDTWSFGVVLYVLVCGKVPFDDPTMAGMHAKVKKGAVDYPPHLSSDCKDLLMHMLETSPKSRISMSNIIIHNWMNKGYDSPVSNFLPIRKPLTLPIDIKVVQGMTGFEFGTEEAIKEELEYLISSKDYQREAIYLEETTHLPYEIHSRNYASLLKKREFKNAMNDFQSMPAVYHPLISVYYLVRERMDREETKTKSQVESETTHLHHHYLKESVHPMQAIPSNDVASFDDSSVGISYTADGKNTFYERQENNDHHKFTIKDITDRKASNGYAFQQQRNVPETNTHHHNKDNVFRRLSRRLSRHSASSDTTSNDVSFDTNSQKHNNVRDTLPRIQLVDKSDPPVVTLNGSLVPNTIDQNAVESAPNQDQTLGKYLNTTGMKRAASVTVKDLPSIQRQHNNAYNSTNRHRKSIISAESYDSSLLLSPTNSRSPNQSIDQADSSVKSVYAKGLFSVSTTSMKKPSVIRKDIIRVLELLSIHYREKKGRFECGFGSSKEVDSIEYSDEDETEHSKSSEEGFKKGVRFDIYIVKIPLLLGMRGVQFRRTSGDPWGYKNVCSKILTQLKL